MPRTAQAPRILSKSEARRIWLRAQRLDTPEPFGEGPEATRRAVEHLGYVQIDTIHVIERSHHHILFTRIPGYRRAHLHTAQSVDKTVFEYWTHALSYVPTRDLRFYLRTMKMRAARPVRWYGAVTEAELRRIVSLIRREGALTIRDIEDEVLEEKQHPWASRKPSKRVLQLAFYAGILTISARSGMLKTYELMDRHFGWEKRPRAASEREITEYLLARALRSQGVVSLDSVCFQEAGRKAALRRLIETKVRRRELVPVVIEGAEKVPHWARPEVLSPQPQPDLVHLLSPFDPLAIQRRRLELFFDYEHRFEAYVPREKRVFGFFALPVLFGEEIVAAIDLKADRNAKRLAIRNWTWVGSGAPGPHKPAIEEALDRFERFQFADQNKD